MIAYLEGVLREKTPTRVVLDVSGVGYEILVPLSTFTELPDEGKTTALRIHTHVREDVLQLFGFASAVERMVFELLIRISGVGPKLAQSILSGIRAEALVEAIRADDISTLCAVPGVGQKTARRIVIDLRDRLDGVATVCGGPVAAGGGPGSADGSAAAREQAISGLVNLGYPLSRAERVVGMAEAELGADTDLEGLIRASLKVLSP